MDALPQIFCVLCDCKNAGNMGAAARAVKNMGCDGLVLVNPKRQRWMDAVKMAPGAEDVLEDARIYGCLEDVLSDINLVIGTTRRCRRYREISLTPEAAIQEAVNLPPGHKIALVFGSERNGLSNEQLSLWI